MSKAGIKDPRRIAELKAKGTDTIKSRRKLVVVKGVSTAQQYALLKDMRCDLMQGYYFSRPLPASAFEKLLARDAALPAPGG